ncbi:MAG: Uma2 family endonuclease [Acidobacteria bacterium]|nr:Uma2 family endonuclease [Acidobacteriota bacterium]MDW7983160.1 Uma2 family endonuclease [Acidobacteriota bacterium]
MDRGRLLGPAWHEPIRRVVRGETRHTTAPDPQAPDDRRTALRLAVYVRPEPRPRGEDHIAPLPVRLWPGKIWEPDIFFIDREHADRLGERFCGAPDLVVEALSPQTRRKDWSEKSYESARSGVTEHWLVDPDRRTVEVFAGGCL